MFNLKINFMKKFNLIFKIVLMLTTISFSGCKDEVVVSSPVTLDLFPKATISGSVTADLNLQTYGSENVPEGTKMLVSIPLSSLYTATTPGIWKDTVEVGPDGKYSVSVPTSINSATTTVTITPFDFEYNQTQAYGSSYSAIKKQYSGLSATVTLLSGQAATQPITYSTVTNADPNFKEKVLISGAAIANLDQGIIGSENLPEGTIINFFTSNATNSNMWKDSVAVKSGAYSISIPKGLPVYYSIKLKYQKKVWVVNTSSQTLSDYQNILYDYTVSDLAFGTYTTTKTDVDIDLGEGVDLTELPLTTTLTATLSQINLNLSDDNPTITYNNVPNGTIVYLFTPTWGLNTTVTNGAITATIPRYVNANSPLSISYLINSTVSQTQSNGTSTATKTISASGNISTTAATTKSVTITCTLN